MKPKNCTCEKPELGLSVAETTAQLECRACGNGEGFLLAGDGMARVNEISHVIQLQEKAAADAKEAEKAVAVEETAAPAEESTSEE